MKVSGFHWRGIGARAVSALSLAMAVFLCAGVCAATATTTKSAPPSHIGIEGEASVTLPRPDYRPRPLDDRTELIVRLDHVTPLTNALYRYDFFFMGLEPGTYNLADYLIRADGGRPDELNGKQLVVRALLPDDHNGQLAPEVVRPFPFVGGYRAFLVLLGVMWVGGWIVFVVAGRKRRPVMLAPVVPPPSLAERLRPLVEAAAQGKLTADGKARLERLLLGFWREKLALPDVRMIEALSCLKAHAEAGALLRALERWLHRREGATPAEITLLLEPYRHP